jgi:hypothetical protein
MAAAMEFASRVRNAEQLKGREEISGHRHPTSIRTKHTMLIYLSVTLPRNMVNAGLDPHHRPHYCRNRSGP